MKKLKYILMLLWLLVILGCTNFHHKKIESINYSIVNGDRVKVITYEDKTQTIENLSLNHRYENNQWNENGSNINKQDNR